MLAAMEDLLDSWPGTLIVVSHDRYFLERVTDQQYAIIDGRLRHVPGGVDEYLRLRDAMVRASATVPANAGVRSAPEPGTQRLSGAGEHAARKELGAAERKLERLAERIADIHERMAGHDQSDYEGLGRLSDDLRGVEAEQSALEERWLELSELVG
jgi:ATPase subunit of ABC transporter with duplicated ATPase domains